MGEGQTRGNNSASDREGAAPSGWVTTKVAAKSLGISPRTVRWHIEHDNLEAIPEGEGVRRSWLVSIDSVQAFRDSRQRQGQLPEGSRGEPGDADIAAESSGNAIRELADRLVEEAAKASEFRVRLELSERAESTLREELADEHRRREEAERERDDLRRELYARREPRESPESPDPSDTPTEGSRSTETPVEHPEGEEVWLDAEGREAQPQEATESPETVEETPDSAEPRSATGGAQEGARRPWWRRVFGR